MKKIHYELCYSDESLIEIFLFDMYIQISEVSMIFAIDQKLIQFNNSSKMVSLSFIRSIKKNVVDNPTLKGVDGDKPSNSEAS